MMMDVVSVEPLKKTYYLQISAEHLFDYGELLYLMMSICGV